MTTNIDLKELERKAFRATFQDGLWDMMLGLIFVILSMVPWFEALGVPRPFGYLIMFGLMVPVWLSFNALKKRITLPRIGIVNFSQDRKKKMRQARIALFVMVLVTIGLVVMTIMGVFQDLKTWGEWSSFLFVGAIFVIAFSLLAYYLDYPRLYAYGWLLALQYPLSVWLENQTGRAFPNGATLLGALIVVITLIRFLRQYPLPLAESA